MQQPLTKTGGVGEITERFFQMEDKLDLFDQQIGGVYFWERVRFALHTKILGKAGLLQQAHSTRSTFDYARIGLRSLANIMYRSPYCAQPSDVHFFGHQRRKLEEDGKWWDIYCDPVIDILDQSYVYIEAPYLGTHLSPAKTQHLRYLDVLYALRVGGNFLRPMPGFSKSETNLLTGIKDELKKRIEVHIPVDEIVHKELLKRWNLLPLYQKLLKRVNPKLAVVVVSYGKYAFVEACKTAGIPVAELQHGSIDKYHPAYSYSGSRRVARCFPDYFLSFGEAWGDLVDLPLKADRIIPVGYPYFDIQREKFGGREKTNQVLFVSQGTIGRDLSMLAVDLREKLSPEYKVVYKLHPGEYSQWERRYPWLVSSAVEVVNDDSVPLYELLAESKVLVGVNSTVIYEGLGFGLKVVLVNLSGIESMYELKRRAHLPVISTAAELVEEIKRSRTVQEVKVEQYFKRDALANMKECISYLVDGSWKESQ
jgi:hypothetical protein